MIFRESFWVVVGGTAPVIALAVVVSMGDLQTPLLRMNKLLVSLGLYQPHDTVTRRQPRSPDWPTQVYVDEVTQRAENINDRTWLMLSLNIGNLGIQAALLCVGLLSIALHTNLIPPWIAVVGETAGVIVLAVIAAFIFITKGFIFRVERLDSSYYPEGQQQDPSGAGS